MVKNFSRKSQIDAYLRALDNTNNFKLHSLESDFVPDLGNIGDVRKEKPKYNNELNKRFQYFKKLKQEAGKCALCDKTFNWNSLVVDHEHSSRKLRGVLCQNCNHGLGKFMDNPELMRKAANYVENFNRDEALDYYSLKGPRKP